MKIAYVHNFYRSATPSGENAVVEREIALLEDAKDIKVSLFSRSNDEARQFPYVAALESQLFQVWNPLAGKRLSEWLRREAPDVVSLHNTFPLISPSALHVVKDAGVPLVWTVHNFRPWCANAFLMRQGEECNLCPNTGSVWPAIKNRCYGNSVALSAVAAASTAFHDRLGTWRELPDVVVAFSQSHAEQLARLGVMESKLYIKPHFVPSLDGLTWGKRENRIMFVGRLSEEKGVDVMLKAIETAQLPAGIEYLIVGDGPLREKLEQFAENSKLNIRVLGALPPAAVQAELCKAKLLLMPSVWRETFGLTVIEAFAAGVPVLASDTGTPAELVRSVSPNMLVKASSVESLAKKLEAVWSRQDLLEITSRKVSSEHAGKYSESVGLQNLSSLFLEVKARAK